MEIKWMGNEDFRMKTEITEKVNQKEVDEISRTSKIAGLEI